MQPDTYKDTGHPIRYTYPRDLEKDIIEIFPGYDDLPNKEKLDLLQKMMPGYVSIQARLLEESQKMIHEWYEEAVGEWITNTIFEEVD